MSEQSEKFPFTVNPNDEFAFVTRTGDTVMPMRLASEDQRDEKGRRIAYSTTDSTTHDGIYESKPVKDDLLKDEHQAQLSDQLDQFARESADLPLLTDTVFVKQSGHIVEGKLTGDTKTIESPSGVHKYAKFTDEVGNKLDVPVEALSLNKQAELNEQKNKPFLNNAKRLIEQSKDMDDATKRMVIDAYIASIERAVAAGSLIAPHDNEPYEAYQIEELFDKFAKALKVFEDPSKKTSRFVMKNVPSGNGLRDAFTALLENEGTAAIFEQAISDKYEKEQSDVSLKQPLGQIAMAGAEVTSPAESEEDPEIRASKIEALNAVQSEIEELVTGISSTDLSRLVQFAAAQNESAQASARGLMSEPLRGNDQVIDDYVKLSHRRAALRQSLE